MPSPTLDYGYISHLVVFFVAHCVLISSDTVFAVLNGVKFLKCNDFHWAALTLGLPFLPGLVSLPFFIWQQISNKDGRRWKETLWKIAQYLAFPVLIVVRLILPGNNCIAVVNRFCHSFFFSGT
jgi:hypothetical protein